MRIISGTLGGRRFDPPNNPLTRPTTDVAKTGLFNILNHNFDFNGLAVLDLFCGTGNISYEFISRGAGEVIAVDADLACINFIKKTCEKFKITKIEAIKGDAFSFLDRNKKTFDIIFIDPPYAIETIDQIPDLILDKKLLNDDGWLILEHDAHHKFEEHPHFLRSRNYGTTIFSIFTNEIKAKSDA